MFSDLQIDDPYERWLVGLADVALRVVALVARLAPTRPARSVPSRILLLRMERIGDLLMTLEAISSVRAAVPGAQIDLVVGSWNAALAELIPGLDRIETLDAPWLARDAAASNLTQLARAAHGWRSRRYDLAINFEADIRTNVLMSLSGAPRRIGFGTGGGGPLLTDVVDHVDDEHTAVNAMRLVERAVGVRPAADGVPRRLELPDHARQAADRLLAGRRNPLVGIHVGGGRRIKQWPPERFAAVATRLAAELEATIVLTGSAADRPIVDAVRHAMPADAPVVEVVDRIDLVTLAAVLGRLSVLVTGDTGPMHLAAALETPIVAIFGPSDSRRYGPRADRTRLLYADLPCSPCNRIRRPPARCVGHVPDCLAGVAPEEVYRAAVDLVRQGTSVPASGVIHGTS